MEIISHKTGDESWRIYLREKKIFEVFEKDYILKQIISKTH